MYLSIISITYELNKRKRKKSNDQGSIIFTMKKSLTYVKEEMEEQEVQEVQEAQEAQEEELNNNNNNVQSNNQYNQYNHHQGDDIQIDKCNINNDDDDENDVMTLNDTIKNMSLNQQTSQQNKNDDDDCEEEYYDDNNIRIPSPPPRIRTSVIPVHVPPLQQPRQQHDDMNHDNEKKEEQIIIQEHVYPSIPLSTTLSPFQPISLLPLPNHNQHQKQMKKQSNVKSLDHFFHKNNTIRQLQHQQQQQIKYYRIIYKGFVALLHEPNLYSKKNGTYLSYGEIITTRNVISKDISLLLQQQQSNNNANNNNQHQHQQLLLQPHPLCSSSNYDDNIIVSSTSQQQRQSYPPLSSYTSTATNTIHSSSSSTTTTTTESSSSFGISHCTSNNTNNNLNHPNIPLQPPPTTTTTNSSNNNTTNTVNIIQIDTILTGGYANDALTKGTSHTHHTPRRSNAKNFINFGSSSSSIGGESQSTNNIHFNCNTSTTSNNNVHDYNNNNNNNSTLMSITSEDKSSTNSGYYNYYGGDGGGGCEDEDSYDRYYNNNNEDNDHNHHGYLLQDRNGIPIAEEIPLPPLLCQNGTFFYRVISNTPLPILAGPSIDAPITRAVALPGTVHEISLRMGSVHGSIMNGGGTVGNGSGSNNSGVDNSYGSTNSTSSPNLRNNGSVVMGNSGFEDGIVYLRLSHRRGWIADRRYVLLPIDDNHSTSPRYRSPNRSSPRSHGRNNSISGASYSNVNRRRCIEFVMKEVSDYVDVSNFEISDEVSLGGTSISSASVATPANILRSRRRPIRRHNERDRRRLNDSRSGMVVMPKAKKKGKSVTVMTQQKEEEIGNNKASSEVLPSPISDVSLLSDQSNKDQVHPHQKPQTSLGEQNNITSQSNNTTTTNGYTEKGPILRDMKPSVFLLRVTAPKGLKILDAPHFQVSNLIRGQGGTSTMPVMKTFKNTSTEVQHFQSINTSSTSAAATVNPSVIFHTMSGSSQTNYGRACSWELDASGKKRILPRGVLFEASSKVERSGNFAHGSGLIKLADGTGWAIIPNKQELQEQYASIQNGTKSNIVDAVESSRGFEEVGNACCAEAKDNQQQMTGSGDTIDPYWVRIVQETGVIVSCAPPSSIKSTQTIRHPSPITASYSSESLHSTKGYESDTASTVSSVFGAFRSKKHDRKLDSLSVVSANSRKRTNNRVNVIPCGTCVRVDPWIASKSHPERQVSYKQL